MSNSQVPVVIFAFNRVKQLKQTIDQLKKNKVPQVIAFIDGARSRDEVGKIDEVEKTLKSITWTKVSITRRKKNLGLSESIQTGLSEVFQQYSSAIVIEDDISVADGFYDYMCRALEVYASRSDIAGVTGLRYPFRRTVLRKTAGDVFLAPRFSSWGWGTWRRVWNEVDFHQGSLVDKVHRHNPNLGLGGRDVEYAYHEYASGRLTGCWDVVFYVNMMLKGQCFVWPKLNLVKNSGLTEGEHASGSSGWSLDWEGVGQEIADLPFNIESDANTISAFQRYFKSVKLPILPRLKRSIKQGLKARLKVEKIDKKPDPKLYTTTDGPQEVLSQKECYYFALNNYLKDNDRVLDVGMGIGYGMGVLSIKAKEVYAVDVDKKAVAYNKARLLGKNPRVKDLVLYNGKKLPFKDNFFDVVTCIDVIEHVEDYEAFLAELIRVSKRAVIIATPNRRPEYTEPDGSPKNYWHLREWSYDEFDAIARRAKNAKVQWFFVDGPWDGPHTVRKTVGSETLVLLPVFVKESK